MLFNVILTCKALYDIALPHLYKNFHLSYGSHASSFRPKQLAALASKGNAGIQYIRHIRIDNRCIADERPSRYPETEENKPWGSNNADEQLRGALETLKRGQLASFMYVLVYFETDQGTPHLIEAS